jgi:hypothetical protein
MRIGMEDRSTRTNQPQYNLIHHKSHINWPGLEPRPPLWEVGD